MIPCPLCETGALTAGRYSDTFRGVKVAGLEYHTCDTCEATPIFTGQLRRNQARITDSILAARVESALMRLTTSHGSTELRRASNAAQAQADSLRTATDVSLPALQRPFTI